MERSLYDDDIYAWSEQQAAVLRQLAGTSDRLSNGLDLEHVAEEIEDVGRSERHAAERALRLVLVHLIKLAAAPGSPAVRHWLSEIVTFHIELLSRFTPALAGRIDLDRLWSQAKRQARANLGEGQGGDPPAALSALRDCPFSLDQVAAHDIDIDAAVRQLCSEE